MALVALQMALGSSSQAAAGTLTTMAENQQLAAGDRKALEELAAHARTQEVSAKADRLLRLLEEFPDKLVLFTQFPKPRLATASAKPEDSVRLFMITAQVN